MSKRYFPLHPAQQDVFMDQLLNTDSPQYNIGGYIVLKGNLHKEKFQEVVNSAPGVFDSFKMRFDLEASDFLYQYDSDFNTTRLSELDFSGHANPEQYAKDWMQGRFNTPFQLKKDEFPFEQFLIKIAEQEYWFFGKYHHLITDGYGFIVYVQYLARKYTALLTGEELPFSYPLYQEAAVSANEYYHSPAYQEDGNYWKEKIPVKPEKLLQKHLSVKGTKSFTYNLDLTEDQRSLLEQIQLTGKAGLQQLTIAALLIYFGKISAGTEFVFGTPIHKRGSRQLRNTMGMFSGILPFKGHYDGEQTLTDLLKDISGSQRSDYRHQNYLVGDLSRDLKINSSEEYLCEVLVNYEPLDFGLDFGEAIESSIIRLANEAERNPLELCWRDYGKQQALQLQVQFRYEYFTEEEIALLARRVLFIIEQFPAKLDQRIGSITILPQQESEQILHEFNDTATDYPNGKSIVELFEEQVRTSPEAIAIVFENEQLSYQELNARSNQLAHYLLKKGVKAETLVPVCIERSINMVIGILGILKAGGAYVPIDPDYPQDRICYMLEDTGAEMVVGSKGSRGKLGDSGIPVVELDSDWELISREPKDSPGIMVSPGQLAYVIYTSGSTGKPKGVMIEHHSLTNYCLQFKHYFSISEKDKILQQSSISFDTMVEELYPALISGAQLIIVKEGGKDIDAIKNYIEKEDISILSTTPTVIEWLNKELVTTNALRYLISGGEVLPPHFINKLYPGVPVVNGYGPSEGTVCATYHKVDDIAYASLIGKSIANVQVYLMGGDKELSPIGVAGEICIGGEGLARGYLNLPDLTAEKFIRNPFSKEEDSRLYKTGDLGRWLPDGSIEYMGRIDDQVKMRGYRVELGEVESILNESKLVSQAVVQAKEDKQGTKRLVGYIVPQGAFDKQAVQNYLGSKLPDYMVPALWVELESIPLTPSGKIDRNAFPDPDLTSITAEYVMPRNETERALAAIWQELLGVERVGVYDNFFELGGHSLSAMRVVSAIRKELNIELAIRDLFEYPTIASLTRHLDLQSGGVMVPEIKAVHPRPAHIPLSFSQERLWFIDRLDGSVQYHEPAVIRINGELNRRALENTLRAIIGRHEVLRTIILEDENGRGYQEIMDVAGWTLTFEDTTKDAPGNLEKHIEQLVIAPFDLSKDYMLRANLVKITDQQHVLVVTMHHIASDGWSISILVKEFTEIYAAYIEGREANLPLLSLQYADYSIWQQNWLQGEVLEEKLQYWKEKLAGVLPLDLPTDRARPSEFGTQGSSKDISIDKELSAKLQALSQAHGATLYMTLLSAFKVLLHRYSGQEDICVGTPVAGRQQQELEGMIGFFVNTLALRSQVIAETSFAAFLDTIKVTVLDAYANQEVPFEKVVDAVVKERDMSRTPLFQVMFDLNNTPKVPELRLGKAKLSFEEHIGTTSKFDISLSLEETTDGLRGSVEYNTDLFNAETIERMLSHFKQLLGSIVADTGQNIGLLGMLTASEEQQLLKEFNGTPSVYPKDKTIIELFGEQAERNPEAIAVIYEDYELTYDELHRRSNQLARYLKQQGVKSETLVPICIERGFEMIIGIFGILKAGGAYVPVDSEYPEDRISYMLEDTGAALVLGSKGTRQKLQGNNASIIEMDGDWAMIDAQISTDLPEKPEPCNLAYVIYTSGSTGRPKGVMVEHGSVVSIGYAWKDAYNLTSFEIRLLQLASMSFDVFTGDICRSLLVGGTLIICPDRIKYDLDELYKFIIKHDINIFESTPGLILPLIKYIEEQQLSFSLMKVLILGSDMLSAQAYQHLRRLYASKFRIINSYGTTETTIDSLYFEGEVSDSMQNGVMPIGKPYLNTQVYILSKAVQKQAVGIPGELYIGGPGVSRGYLHLADLTAERFVDNPYGPGRLYRTGDMGRWLEDGNIEYLGRMDEQVKIRGYRIELGEIENVLNECDLVSKGVVLAKTDNNGNKRLVGYVVASGRFDKQEIQIYLNSKLPDYMVPAIWVELKSIPLTPNGKIDKKALPDPELADRAGEYVAPRNGTEQALAEIWQELLGLESPPGIYDNFFELGGHSLLAMRVVSAIRRKLNIELNIRDLFIYPTIAGLGAYLDKHAKGSLLPALATMGRPEYIPLSFSQERLWFIDQLEGSVQYHIPAVLRLKGELKREVLESTLRAIIARHEVLRTVILEHEGRGYQHILAADNWSLDITEELAADEAGLKSYIPDLINKPFDLSEDYMLRADLIKLGLDDHILVVTMHHIASDGWSVSILVKEVVALYEGYAGNVETVLPPLTVQYADYAIWQRKYLRGEVLYEKLEYWKTRLDDVALQQLPTDFSRPVVQSSLGATRTFKIKQDLSAQLTDLSHQQGATLYMTLLAAFNVLLYRYSGQEDMCVGTPVAGRNQQELEALIGFFVNTLALRSRVSGDMPFTALLQEVKETTLGAFAHQEVPFEKVVDAVVRVRDMSRNPLFQAVFVLQNTPDVPELKLGELKLTEERYEDTTSKFDIAFLLTETSSGIQGTVEYATDLYKEETIDRMIGHYLNLLESILNAAGEQVSRLSMLSAIEEKAILEEFNNTTSVYPKDKSIAALFEEQVHKTPEAVAIVFGRDQLTYGELNARSNQLAHYLRGHGVKAETLVPICVERSIDMMVGILGILKAGAAYVPIDPDYPADRISYMLEDTAARLVVSSSGSREKLSGSSASVIELDGDWDLVSSQPSANLALETGAADLAYVIYTSGSTGRPKGVMIENRSVVSLVKGAGYVAADEEDTLLVTGSPSFDATTFEYWSMLLNGGRLILCRLEELLDSELLKTNIRRHKVSMMWFTSSWFNQLVDSNIEVFAGLNTVLVGGEKLSEHHIEKIREAYPGLKLINGYGPTENTTFSLTYAIGDIPQGKAIPVGRPLNNRTAYVLTPFGQLSPIGGIGEICLGGAGLARGYLNNPGLTAEKFINAPFSTEPGTKLYKTGDLGRWLPDGNIEYLGRIDDQVKIRGYRIELGEVESVLNESDLVSQAVVLAKADNNGSKRLVGYVVSSGMFDKQAIQDYLSTKLADYMIPALWVELDQLPLTSNGKVDRKALPDPDLTDMAAEYVAPRNATEQALTEIWQELLGVERVGIYDNFFELGGDSILTIQVVSRMRRLGYVIQPKDIFNYQVIASLSDLIGQSKIHTITGEQGILSGSFGLLPIQSWYLENEPADTSHFNQSVLLKINKNIDATVIQEVSDQIMSRHDALRLAFEKKSDIWQQTYRAELEQLHQEDLRFISQNNLEKEINSRSDAYQRSLSIEEGKVIKMVWMQTPVSEEANRLLIVIHHLVVDGVSWRILLSDIDQLLNSLMSGQQISLGVKYSSYRQWYEALVKYKESRGLSAQKEYWQRIIASYKSLPEDKGYSETVLVKDMLDYQVKLGIEQTQQLLLEVPKAYHTDINDLLLSALSSILCKWSDTGEVVIGLEGHGREAISAEIDTSEAVGWYTSLYPVLLKRSIDAATLIKGVKEELRRIPDKGLGYGVLKYISKTEGLQGRDPWDVIFNYLGQLDTIVTSGQWLALADESSGTEASENQASMSRLSVNSHIFGGELVLKWSYSSKHYNQKTISKLAGDYIKQLMLLISHCLEQGKSGVVNTPADYGLSAEISFQELDQFLEEPYMDDDIMSF